LPPVLPSIEHRFTPFCTILLMVLIGSVLRLVNVELVTWNGPLGDCLP